VDVISRCGELEKAQNFARQKPSWARSTTAEACATGNGRSGKDLTSWQVG